MDLTLTNDEILAITPIIRAEIERLDEIMENEPTREIADQSNMLEDVLAKFGEE